MKKVPIVGYLQGKISKVLICTFLAKIVSFLGALSLVVVVGHVYGAKGVGIYALAQSVLLGSGILARRGMDRALIRFVGRDVQAPKVYSYLRWAIFRSLLISAPLLALIFLARGYIERFFSFDGLSDMLIGISLAIPFYTSSFLFSGFLKSIRKPANAVLQENGVISSLVAVFIVLFAFFAPSAELDFSLLGWAYFLSAVLVSILGFFVVKRWVDKAIPINDRVKLSEGDVAEFNIASSSFLVISMASFIQGVIGVFIAGRMLGEEDLGLFKSASQIAVSVAFVLVVINAIYPPRFAALYHKNKMLELGSAARKAAILGGAFSAPLLAICFLFPSSILGLLGKEFVSGDVLLRILSLAQFISVLTGSVAFLLNMTGHEKVMRNIALFCNGIGLLSFLLLIPLWGALGAALSLALVLVLQNLVALYFVWKKLGIWTLPIPNVFHLIGVKAER